MEQTSNSLNGEAKFLEIILSDVQLAALIRNEGCETAGQLLNYRAGSGFTAGEYWEKLKAEIRILLCDKDAPQYEDLRKAAKKSADAIRFLGVPAITAAVAGKVGLEEAMLSPFVAMLLFGLGDTALNTYCKTGAVPKISLPEKTTPPEEP